MTVTLVIAGQTIVIAIADPQDLVALRQDLLDAERKTANLIEEYGV